MCKDADSTENKIEDKPLTDSFLKLATFVFKNNFEIFAHIYF